MIPGLSVVACLYLMTNLSVETWLRFLVWMVIGIPVYGLRPRKARLAAGVAGADSTSAGGLLRRPRSAGGLLRGLGDPDQVDQEDGRGLLVRRVRGHLEQDAGRRPVRP